MVAATTTNQIVPKVVVGWGVGNLSLSLSILFPLFPSTLSPPFLSACFLPPHPAPSFRQGKTEGNILVGVGDEEL